MTLTYKVSCFLLVFFEASESKRGLIVLDVEHIEKVWNFDMISIIIGFPFNYQIVIKSNLSRR